MKKFNIIRYLKRWWPLIALMSIFAGAFFMRYASNNQAYTAQAVIKYTYDAASEGLTPEGGAAGRFRNLFLDGRQGSD